MSNNLAKLKQFVAVLDGAALGEEWADQLARAKVLTKSTNAELAEVVGVTESAVSRYMTGARFPGREKLRAMVNYMESKL